MYATELFHITGRNKELLYTTCIVIFCILCLKSVLRWMLLLRWCVLANLRCQWSSSYKMKDLPKTQVSMMAVSVSVNKQCSLHHCNCLKYRKTVRSDLDLVQWNVILQSVWLCMEMMQCYLTWLNKRYWKSKSVLYTLKTKHKQEVLMVCTLLNDEVSPPEFL
jgi:hypothetical protein